MREKSLCGDSFGCMVANHGQIGENWTVGGQLSECGLCLDRATAVLRFLIGEDIRFDTKSWAWLTVREFNRQLNELSVLFFG